MYRKVAVAFLLVACLFFTSCSSSCTEFMQQSGLKQYLSANASLHGRVQFISYGEADGFYTVSYDKAIYRGAPDNIFCYDDGKVPTDDLVMIGWLSRFPYRTYYYSYTEEAPVYLIDTFTNVTHLREDFDYMSEVFILDGTNKEITLSNVTGEKLGYDPLNSKSERITVVLHSKHYPALRARLTVSPYNDHYIVKFAQEEIYACSGEFIQVLKENGMITQ